MILKAELQQQHILSLLYVYVYMSTFTKRLPFICCFHLLQVRPGPFSDCIPFRFPGWSPLLALRKVLAASSKPPAGLGSKDAKNSARSVLVSILQGVVLEKSFFFPTVMAMMPHDCSRERLRLVRR